MTKTICGNEMDRMPGWAFRIMSAMFFIQDMFKPAGVKLDPISIKEGNTVVDWGCGTGRYLKRASELAGKNGRVYAVDIHALAINSAHRRIRRHELMNVFPVLTDGVSVDIPSGCADVIFAFDMFHMVSNPTVFLKELKRISRENALLYLEDGHQPRELSKEKILKSGAWKIVEEKKIHLVCQPVK